MTLMEAPTTPTATLRHTDPSSLEAQWQVRRIVVDRTETLSEAGSLVPHPIIQASAAAVVTNPWIGTPTDTDLTTEPRLIAARLAKLLSDRLLAAVGGPEQVAAFGKGALIGVDGELEHGAALTHIPYFASNLRTFLEGSAVISFADTRAEPGEVLTLPLCDKTTGIRRDHYQTVRVSLPDAPRADEIVLAAAVSTGSRPFPRVGDRSTDRPLDTQLMNGAFL